MIIRAPFATTILALAAIAPARAQPASLVAQMAAQCLTTGLGPTIDPIFSSFIRGGLGRCLQGWSYDLGTWSGPVGRLPVDLSGTTTLTDVPEPRNLALLAVGLVAVAAPIVFRRRPARPR